MDHPALRAYSILEWDGHSRTLNKLSHSNLCHPIVSVRPAGSFRSFLILLSPTSTLCRGGGRTMTVCGRFSRLVWASFTRRGPYSRIHQSISIAHEVFGGIMSWYMITHTHTPPPYGTSTVHQPHTMINWRVSLIPTCIRQAGPSSFRDRPAPPARGSQMGGKLLVGSAQVGVHEFPLKGNPRTHHVGDPPTF